MKTEDKEDKIKRDIRKTVFFLVFGMVVLTIILIIVAMWLDSNNKLTFIEILAYSVEISSVLFLAKCCCDFKALEIATKNWTNDKSDSSEKILVGSASTT